MVDRLATRVAPSKPVKKRGLNLTFEVRDGIVCHCGENYEEYQLTRDPKKDVTWMDGIKKVNCMPYTLEACIVRLVDKIAYVGRDIEDALRVNLMDINDIPLEIRKELGNTNSEIINTLVCDIIENSYDRDCIQLSPEKGEALESLIKENMRLIYQSERIKRYEKMAKNILEGLFFELLESVKDIEKLKSSNLKVHKHFYNFIQDVGYGKNDSDEQKVVDFVAGMTDNYAINCFNEIFWM